MAKRGKSGDAVEKLLLRATALILLSSRQPSERLLGDPSLCSLCHARHPSELHARGFETDEMRTLLQELFHDEE